MSEISRCWGQRFGVIVDAGTSELPIATAIWRDAQGTFHLLAEQDLHLGKRLIRTHDKMHQEALRKWDLKYASLAAVDDATKTQWTWDKLVAIRAEVAQETGVQNPLVLVTELPGNHGPQEVFSLHNPADFAALVADWLRIVKQREEESGDPPDVFRRQFAADCSPLFFIVDGDKWTAPQVRT